MITGTRTVFSILAAVLMISGTAFAAFSYTIVPISDPPKIYTGDSTKVQFSIRSTNYLYDGKCIFKLDDGLLSNEYTVSPDATLSISADVRAPSEGSGSGSTEHTIHTYCYESAYPGDSTKIYRNASFTLYYDDSRYVARTAMNSAQNAIDSAQSIINSTIIAIIDARNIGADVIPAENKLSGADKYFRKALTRLSFANSYFVSSDYNRSVNISIEAKSLADTAKSEADIAYTMAIQEKRIKEAGMAIQSESGETAVSGFPEQPGNRTGENDTPAGTKQESPSFDAVAVLTALCAAYLAKLRRD